MPKPKDFKGNNWPGRKAGAYKWYEIQDAVDYFDEFEKPKILYQVFQVKPCFIWDESGYYCNNAIWIIPESDKVLLAILNSTLGWFLISKYCTQIQNGYQLIFKYLENLPVAISRKDKAVNDIEKLVDQLLQLNNNLFTAKLPAQKELLQNRINWCEEKVNALVYQLYELTEDEIETIEKTTN